MNESLAYKRIINFYKKLIKGVMVLFKKYCTNEFCAIECLNDSYGGYFIRASERSWRFI